jgi:hypothetical protein
MIKRRKMRLNGVWRRVAINRVYELRKYFKKILQENNLRKYFRPRTFYTVFFCKMNSKNFPKNWLIITFYSIFESKMILSEVALRRKIVFQSTRHKI